MVKNLIFLNNSYKNIILREVFKPKKEESLITYNENVCFMCGDFFGIFDKKQCIICKKSMCEKCASLNEVSTIFNINSNIFFLDFCTRKKFEKKGKSL